VFDLFAADRILIFFDFQRAVCFEVSRAVDVLVIRIKVN
jgi:hypothetical protein